MRAEIRSAVIVAAAAASLMAITMGSRSSFGLFVSPLNTATGLGLITISFAAALNQLLWGAAQPFVGALSDRFGASRVLATGGLLLAAGTAMIPFAQSGAGLVFGFSMMAIAGAAAGGNGLLLGEVSRRVSPEQRGLAVGIVGAGGSIGQLVLGPGTQGLISSVGWEAAMFGLAALALLGLPLAMVFRTPVRTTPCDTCDKPPSSVRTALASPAFWYISGGFFVCGFHVAFLTSHMPGVIALCGLSPGISGWWLAIVGMCNIIGSIAAGAAIRRGSMRRALMVLYGLRAVGVALFLALPKSEWVVLGFAGWMGLTYMATLPPTAGLIGKLFGLERMATVLGAVMFVHQTGAFLGVWLGGIVVTISGSYDWIWYADIVLAVLAAAIHLPLREDARPARTKQSGDAAGQVAMPTGPQLQPSAG
jgi:predicted MFS family arabinose efflux permease